MTTVLDVEPRTHQTATRLRPRTVLEDDETGWRLDTTEAIEAARLRHAFRDYLEAYGHPASDFGAAESVYGELVANCVCHAPGRVRVRFSWSDSSLSVSDGCDRLRSWPFSPGDSSREATHHGYAIVSALTARVQLARESDGGTRATVVLPVLRDLLST